MPESIRAGFWKRLLAFVIDLIIVGLVLIFASLILRNILLQLGENLWYIGFVLFGVYFVFFHSGLGKGQTLGKRMVGLRVVKSNNKFMTIGQSVIRYVLLGLVIFSNGIARSIITFTGGEYLQVIFGVVSAILIFGIVGLIGFTSSKRGLHDYLLGTAVVKNKNLSELSVGKLESLQQGFAKHRKTFIGLGSVFVLYIIVAIFISSFISKNVIGQDLINLGQNIQASGLASGVVMSEVYGQQLKNLVVNGYVPYESIIDDVKAKALEEEIKQKIFSTYPDINEFDNVRVVIRSGYNLGISSFNISDYKDYPVKKNK